MTAPATRPRKPIYRMVSFWLSLLMILYALVGFVIVPWWLKQQLPKQLQEQLGWQSQVSDIYFDPFGLTLEIDNLQAKDAQGAEVVAFKRLFVNLSFWSLFRGVIDFDDIQLDQPFVRLDLLKHYQLNLVRDWQQRHPTTTDKAPSKEAGSPPPLLLSHIEIKGGHIKLRDFSQAKPAEFNVAPIDLSLNNIGTLDKTGDAENAGHYQLSAKIGEKQSLQWEGSLNLLPFQSQGKLKLEHIDQATIWHFAAAYAPYHLAAGDVSVTTGYNLDIGNRFNISTHDGSVELNNVAVGLIGDATADAPQNTLLKAANIKVSGIHFDLDQQQLGIADIAAQDLDIALRRDKTGALNVMRPFQSSGDDKPANPAGGGSAAFRWSIQHIGLKHSQVSWYDGTLTHPDTITLSDISAEAGGLSDKLDSPINYSLQLQPGTQGSLQVTGDVTPQPFTLSSKIRLDQMALAGVQGYLQQSVAMKVKDGTASFSGELNLGQKDNKLSGTLSGDASVDQLATQTLADGQPLVDWQKLAINQIQFNLQPLVFHVGQVQLTEPTAHIIRLNDKQTNLDELAVASAAPAKAAPAPAAQKDTSEAGPWPVLRIDHIALQKGQVDLEDRSMKPAVNTRLHDLNGTITGLTNVRPEKAKLDLKGLLGDYGQLNVNGELGAIGKQSTTQFTVKADNISLPPLSPYFGRYLGYQVANGKLALSLDYKIEGKHLESSNRVNLDQLDLGAATDSPDAVKAPVKLGLALLRNRDGVIDMNIPVSGDLDDPSFSVSSVVLHAFVNLIVRAATTPFAVLGTLTDLAGLTGDELSHARFEPGSAQIPESEQKKLKGLAEALAKRPQLILNISGGVAPAADRIGLGRARIMGDLDQQLGADAALGDRIKALESRLRSQQGAAALAALEKASGVAGAERLQSTAWENALLDALAKTQKLPADALTKLANARAQSLQHALVTQYQAPPKQLFVKSPEMSAKFEQGKVVLGFSMGTR
ncbi:DUF748 domain-containing protein [Mangrovitalea sediminis]|uniref:DUF748 domain-containing protein n=1 Tax=Mangrovitalea sediminis TaxID=1982043 RepID=UPI000BE55286|nr:DUF748 domain-containing protein [Mangrovitalea sediminis]